MVRIIPFLKSWERTGLSSHDSWKERNRIILLNRFVMIFVPAMLIIVVINLFLSFWLSALLNSLLLVCILAGQWLTYLRRHQLARWTILLPIILIMDTMIVVFGREIGGYMTFMVLGVGGVIMFDTNRSRFLLIGLLFGSFVVAEAFLQTQGTLIPLVYPQLLYPITFLPNFFAVGLLVWFFGSLQNQHDLRMELMIRELEEKNRELATSNQLLQTYSHTISHHIKSPLKNISSLLEAYSRSEASRASGPKSRLLDLAIRQSAHLAKLAQNLLHFSSLSRRGDPLSQQDVSLNQVMEQISLNLSNWIEEKGAVIEWNDLPSLRLWEGHAELLLQNLVENGLKYNRSDKPTVKVSGSREGDLVMLHVQDNGIGISPEYQTRVFELFSRLHSNEDFEGSGMGLAICHTIVTQAGGHISLSSVEGEGTEVRIVLPQTGTQSAGEMVSQSREERLPEPQNT